MRRRLYEIIRHEQPKLNSNYDVAVIVTSAEVLGATHDDLQAAVRDLFTQAGMY